MFLKNFSNLEQLAIKAINFLYIYFLRRNLLNDVYSIQKHILINGYHWTIPLLLCVLLHIQWTYDLHVKHCSHTRASIHHVYINLNEWMNEWLFNDMLTGEPTRSVMAESRSTWLLFFRKQEHDRRSLGRRRGGSKTIRQYSHR